MNNQCCHDCNENGVGSVFYRCNACDVNVCRSCIMSHYPIEKYHCPSCDTFIEKGTVCIMHAKCSYCLAIIDLSTCVTCEIQHLSVGKVVKCCKCQLEGCEESVRLCGFAGDIGNIACDKYICFNCGSGYGCIDNRYCDTIRCCFEHGIQCRECGCCGNVRCRPCELQFGRDDGPLCIDCINGFNGPCKANSNME